ncbi:acetyl-CoA carboxylase biotin carboxyl carrier protein [Clostridium butyricum]|jgi:acetyl-CoA carboxylase biotin carboxyl carrier protein|uniref:Biotin carboxyl carrier protein of acetyl-CoA carboxylase n=1 Tax=Clostridium butyricum TaxID=1492 RepID=A0A2S7FDL3_CLOBU|nr:acetyl-CoA carboxylase biotin carboxyl carrier protein [Clostridium butyricum]ETI91262.1 MAG: Acetyl-CoA carboxylase, biotin carboxyl carrier protein [Clostridium butyricum DORA_1]KHD15594.1 acetyl-CoA carboxylase [Clostridium butyricum]MDK2828061.1 acetyl-CoA carboxylase biotin carboxyl carrier protein [Clostridium butyricum]MDU1003646.1 acetyl-CoA carboxylase biotin carboxyl carrier protein [Clostridium butyricum]MDU1510076.1 acetyl-CoA carboxylase biotin carboxyl carrier protein [Clostri
MEFEQIKELITLIDTSDLAFFELSDGNSHIKMDKSLNRGVSDNTVSTANDKISTEQVVEKPIANSANNEIKKLIKEEVKEEVKEEEESNLSIITSPMVGTFYSAASPDTPAFVKVGDIISKGKVICIIEAMKLMNEIESEYNGEIVECLIKDGDMVEYGQPLFKIKEA